MKYLIPITLIILLMGSCSSAVDQPYNEETFAQDAVELKEELSKDELVLISMYIMRQGLTGDQIAPGTTYGELLQEAKEAKAEQERKAKEEEERLAKLRAEEQARLQKLKDAIDVAVINKEFHEGTFTSKLGLTFNFDNNSQKEIKAFTGAVIAYDQFGEEIKRMSFKHQEPVATTTKTTYYWDVNEYIDGDVALVNADLKDLKFEWQPEAVIFTDGTTLER